MHGWDAQIGGIRREPRWHLRRSMTLAAEYGADLRAIAIVQVMRVVLLTIGIPTGLALFGLTAAGGGLMARLSARSAVRSSELAMLVAVVDLHRARAGVSCGLPGGLMFGAMLGSGILHGGGFIHSVLPFWWVAYAR